MDVGRKLGAPPRSISFDASVPSALTLLPSRSTFFAPYAVVYTGAGVVTALSLGSIDIFCINLERGRGMERGRVVELATIFGAAAVLAYLAVLTAVNLYAIDNYGT